MRIKFIVFLLIVFFVCNNTATFAVVENVSDCLFSAPEIIDDFELSENNYIAREKKLENSLYDLTFINSDGSYTMRVFNHPVKYKDINGSIKDISLDIIESANGGYVTSDNSIITYFPVNIGDGVEMTYDIYRFNMSPASYSSEKSVLQNKRTVLYELDNKTKLEYSLTYTGFKENIIINEYNGITKYDFILKTYGLKIVDNAGTLYLCDNDRKIAKFSDIIVFTADEKNNFTGNIEFVTLEESSDYLISICLNNSDLCSERTVYPIRIDPSIEILYYEGIIEDVTINQNSTYSGNSGALYVGRDSSGYLSRTLMRFNGLDMPVKFAPMIISASIEVRDLMCQGNEDMYIYCHAYNENANSWSENSTTTWNSVGDNIVGSQLDYKLVTYGNGNVSGQNHRYSFNITQLAKDWADGVKTPEKGVVFKASSSFENNGTDRWYKTFASVNRNTYQPSLKITYEKIAIFGLFTYANCIFEPLYVNDSSYPYIKKTSSVNYYNGAYLWCVEYMPEYESLAISSLGLKALQGETCYSITTTPVNSTYLYGNDMLSPYQRYKPERYGGIYYTLKNEGCNYYLSLPYNSDILSSSSVNDSTCAMCFSKISTNTFNNFWSGGYSTGYYQGKYYIQIEVNDSVYAHSLYSGIDFYSVVSMWNGIAENIVILNTNDSYPNGVIPLKVRFRLETDYGYDNYGNPRNPYATTLPCNALYPDLSVAYYYSGYLSDSDKVNLTVSDWTSVNIYLNGKTVNNPFYDVNATSTEISNQVKKVICHEMGHALKLAHPMQSSASGTKHTFTDCRNDYSGNNSVLSLMNKGPYYSTDSNYKLTARTPQYHDYISLISKWEYHINCND